MFQGFFRKARNRPLINRLHGEVVAAARQNVLYSEYGVRDSFEGRFEMMAVHSGLLLTHLQGLPLPGRDIAQDLIDAIFENFDAALREIGVGDISVGKKMGRLAEAFLGRTRALDLALVSLDPGALEATLLRNALAGQGDAPRLTRYVRSIRADLQVASLATILGQPVPFPDASATK